MLTGVETFVVWAMTSLRRKASFAQQPMLAIRRSIRRTKMPERSEMSSIIITGMTWHYTLHDMSWKLNESFLKVSEGRRRKVSSWAQDLPSSLSWSCLKSSSWRRKLLWASTRRTKRGNVTVTVKVKKTSLQKSPESKDKTRCTTITIPLYS